MTTNFTEHKKILKWEWKDIILLLVLTSITIPLFFNRLDEPTMDPADESFYSLHDEYLLLKNTNIFFPDNNLKNLYYVKPPLKSWIKYPILKLFGYNTFTLRFLDALFATLTVIIVFLFGKRMMNSYAGFTAGAALLTSEAMVKGVWARTNGYDAGFIMGAALFFLLFVFHFEKKYEWIWCGLSLAFAFFFKHLAAFILILTVILFLLLLKNWKTLFSRRFFGMLALGTGLPLLWFVPFAIKNSAFLSIFIRDELTMRVVTGYHTFPGVNKLFYYFPVIYEYLGVWFFIFIPMLVIAFFYMIRNKDDKLLFILIWAVAPLTAFTISKSRLGKYIFLIFPALALIISYGINAIINEIKKRDIRRPKMKLVIIALPLIAIIIINWCGLFSWTNSPFIKPYDRISDIFKTDTGGKILFYNLKTRNFDWAERCHLYELLKKDRFVDQGISIDEVLSKLRGSDALLLSRKDFINWLYEKTGSEKILLRRYLWVSFSSYFDYIVSQHLMKVMIVKKESPYVRGLEAEGLEFFQIEPLESIINLNIPNNKDFLKRAAEVVFGFSLDKFEEDRYLKMLSLSNITRSEILERFICFARNEHILHFPPWRGQEGLEYISKYTRDISHIVVDYQLAEKNRRIYVLGLKLDDLDKVQECFFKASSKRWIDLASYEGLSGIIAKIQQSDCLLLNGVEYLKILSDPELEKQVEDSFNYIDLVRVPLYKYGSYYLTSRRIAVFPKNGEFNLYVEMNNLKANRLKPLRKMINWEIKDNRKFIIDVSKATFGRRMPENVIKALAKKLDTGLISRREMVQNLVERIISKIK